MSQLESSRITSPLDQSNVKSAQIAGSDISRDLYQRPQDALTIMNAMSAANNQLPSEFPGADQFFGQNGQDSVSPLYSSTGNNYCTSEIGSQTTNPSSNSGDGLMSLIDPLSGLTGSGNSSGDSLMSLIDPLSGLTGSGNGSGDGLMSLIDPFSGLTGSGNSSGDGLMSLIDPLSGLTGSGNGSGDGLMSLIDPLSDLTGSGNSSGGGLMSLIDPLGPVLSDLFGGGNDSTNESSNTSSNNNSSNSNSNSNGSSGGGFLSDLGSIAEDILGIF